MENRRLRVSCDAQRKGESGATGVDERKYPGLLDRFNTHVPCHIEPRHSHDYAWPTS